MIFLPEVYLKNLMSNHKTVGYKYISYDPCDEH